MNDDARGATRTQPSMLGLAAALACGFWATGSVVAQGPGTEAGQWTYLGGDAWHTRHTPAEQITPSNFEELEIAWRVECGQLRPQHSASHADLRRRQADHGERQPSTRGCTRPGNRAKRSGASPSRTPIATSTRCARAMGRASPTRRFDGRGVVLITSPGFFLHALDVETGRPLENWGRPVPLPGFGASGTVDLVEDLIAGWAPWTSMDRPYDPNQGIPLEIGYITSSSTADRGQRHRGRGEHS